VNVKQLAHGYPAARGGKAPKDTEFFQGDVQLAKCLHLLRAGGKPGRDDEFNGIKHEIVESLAKGESLRLGKAGRAVERPVGQFDHGGINRKGRGRHDGKSNP